MRWSSLGFVHCVLLLACGVQAHAAGGAADLDAAYQRLAPELVRSGLGVPILLQSTESDEAVGGEAHAVLQHPFARVAVALAHPPGWCDIFLLHLNTKSCRLVEGPAGTRLDVRIGSRYDEPVESASPMSFDWQRAETSARYVHVQLAAATGPYGTSDYRLHAQAIPLDPQRTFVRLSYGFGFGPGSRFAMAAYFATVGRGKVGFTSIEGKPVAGVRGAMERNTLRYLLAIDAVADGIRLPAAQRTDHQMQAWFDATERYPRQLRELPRDEYLRMKQREMASTGMREVR
jgi:hypothetical protein